MVRQSILSLSGRHEIDYLGPVIIDEAVNSRFNRVVELEHDPGYAGMAGTLFRGAATGYHKSWRLKSAGIDWGCYDLVHLEYSRHAFIARQVRSHSKRMVVRVHNVEKDYYSTQNLDRRSFQNRLRTMIKRYLIARQEGACLAHADCVICLTAGDRERLKELYSTSLRKCRLEVVPVSIEQPRDFSNPPFSSIEKIEDNPYLLITGSLWFGPNAEGSAWFVKKVWHRLQESNRELSTKYRLVIAGSKPGKEIRSLAARYDNIDLIDTPPDMKPYFEGASIYLAPLFSGAGMKVKVAEALSYGLPVIGTSHAWGGYRIACREDGYRAEDADGFVEALKHYSGLPVEGKKDLRVKAYKNYRDHHSIEASARLFQRVIDSLKKGEG